MPKSSGIGLAGLGCAGSYPTLEIPVRCHLAFRGLDRRSPSDLDARDKRTRTATRDKSPFASTEDRAGDGRERFGVGPAAGNSSDRLSWQQVMSAVMLKAAQGLGLNRLGSGYRVSGSGRCFLASS